MEQTNRHQIRGYILGILAAAAYGTNPLFALPLYARGMSVDSVLFYRYAIATVLMSVLMLAKGESFKVRRSELPALLIAGILFALSSLLLFVSYNYMDVGIASTILFVYPVFVAILMSAMFHEQISPVTVLAIALALMGIVLLSHSGGGASVSVIGIILVVLSSLAYAIYMVALNKSRLRHVTSLRITFYSLLFGSMLFVVRLGFLTRLQPVEGAVSWMCILSLGMFPTIISLIAMTVAIHDIGSTPTAILGALEPVTALAIGVAIFGETLTSRSISGILLVLVAVTLVVVSRPLTAILRRRRK
ncbi:MAG: DMT family transporter [Pseudoflavonifractor sp.]|nr:DMT family transporter [Pseudoflavonifractor sp.]